MELPEHLYTDPPLAAPPERSVLLLVAGSGSVVLVLALLTCVCWSRNSSGRFSNRGNSRRDTVPLDDLLSKPSLAEPESVFSEAASNEFRPIPGARSWFLPSGDENSFSPESGSTSGASPGERDRGSSHVLAGHIPGTDHNTGLLPKPGNNNKQLIKNSKSPQRHELEQLQNQHNDTASRLPAHRLKSAVEGGYLCDKLVHKGSAGVQTTSPSSRVAGHNEISEKVGLDPSLLKIHRDSVASQDAPFLSSARCSFSHEVGHVVHGKQTPRPSLPRTEEVENGHADPSSDATKEDESSRRATELPVVGKHDQSEVLISPDLTVNSHEQVRGQTGLVRSETKDNNRRPTIGHPCFSTQVSQKPGDGLAGSTCTGACDNPDICRVKHQLSAGRPTSDLHQSRPAAVTMRRCLSCVQGDVVCPYQATTRPGRQTFSLNLKINVHFDNETDCSQGLPTVVCSPLTEYTGLGHCGVTNSCLASDSINTKNNSINDNNTNSLGVGSVKERQLEKSFANKSQHANAKPVIIARKRSSEPMIAEVSQVKTCSTRPLSRRLSQTESLAAAVATAALVRLGNAARCANTVGPENSFGHENAAIPENADISENAVRLENAVRPGVAARDASRRNLLAADADTTYEFPTAAIPGNRRRQETCMAADAGSPGTNLMAWHALASQEITVSPTAFAGTATADTEDQICPTGASLSTAVRSQGSSNARTVRTEVSDGAETETGAGGPGVSTVLPLSDADSLQENGGRQARVSNIVININGRSSEQQPPDWVVAHILTDTEPVGLSVERSGGVTAGEKNVYRKEGSTSTRVKDSKVKDSQAKDHQEDGTSCRHPAITSTSATSVTITNTSYQLPGGIDQKEAVVSSQSADEYAASESESCKPECSVWNPSISADCEKSTEMMTDPDTNIAVEFTASTDLIEGSAQADTDATFSQKSTDTNKAGAGEASERASLKQNTAADNASSSFHLHRRALTAKEGHDRRGPQKKKTLDAYPQRSSSLRTLSFPERVHRSVGASANTKDRRQAVFYHDTKYVLESSRRLSRQHTQGRESENTASVGVAGTQGRVNGSRVQVHQANNSDQITSSEVANSDCSLEEADSVAITEGHIQQMKKAYPVAIITGRIQEKKQRLAASNILEHVSTLSCAAHHGKTAEAQRTSAPEEGTARASAPEEGTARESAPEEGTAHASAPKPAARRLAVNKETGPAPVCETDISVSSVITVTVEDSADSRETAHVSDDSDYDNPWDSLDDAVKRASIRYNRRPSRIAAGDSKTLLLKSAEDLGRLLEEADKRRQSRQTRNSCQVSPEMDSLTIPLTRFSPHRHTVKEVISQTYMATAHSTENILKIDKPTCPKLSLVRQGHAAADDHKGMDTRRPMSLTSKVRAKITSPEMKHRKK